MNPLADGIIHSTPMLGQPLFVEDNNGQIVDSGVVTACEFRSVLRGGSHPPLHATMIFVRTTRHADGFSAYPGPEVSVPEPFRSTVRKVA